MTTILITFCLALLLSLALTPLAGKVGKWLGAMDRPNARKVHKSPIARTGGMAVFIAFAATLVLAKLYRTQVTDLLRYDREILFLAAGGVIVFAVGLVDDFKGVNSKVKLLFQILAAGVACYGGITVGNCSLWGVTLDLGVCSYLITVFWFVLFINAVNLIDGLDGLAGGVSFFASLVMIALSLMRKDLLMAMLFAGLSGSILGFLRYNFNPASIFLGDGGSYFIGYSIAGLALLGSVKSQVGVAVLIPLVALGVPLFDTLLATVRRFLRAQKLFGADAGHIHHRLLKLGLSTRHAVLLLYGATIALGGFAMLLVNSHDEQAALLLGILGLGAFIFVRKLGYFEYIASDKIFGWFKDLGDEVGFSRARRSFLSLQIDIGQSETLSEMWLYVNRALKLLDLDRAMLYLAGGSEAAVSPQNVFQRMAVDDRRGVDRDCASICMRRSPPEFEWTSEKPDVRDRICSRCLFRLELPLLGQDDEYLGTLVLIKDKALGGLKPYVLRRVEALKRTMASTLKHIAVKEKTLPERTGGIVAAGGGEASCPVAAEGMARSIDNCHRLINWRKGDLLLLQFLGWRQGAAVLWQQYNRADWQSVIAASVRHYVAPLLYLVLKHSGGLIEVPRSVASELRQLYLQITRHNMRLFHDLGKVLSALKEQGIPVIVLKGAYLGETVYRNIGVRTLTDVDLLFKKEDFQHAVEVLNHRHLLSHDSGLFLDLHWNIGSLLVELNLNMDAIWAAAEPATVAGVEVFALGKEDLLLHLCAQMIFCRRMAYAGLRTLCDIREVLAHFENRMNWHLLFTKADQIGIRNAIELSLFLANDFLDAPIPESVVTRFTQERITDSVRRWAVEKIFDEQPKSRELSAHFWELLIGGPWYRKLFFPSKSSMLSESCAVSNETAKLGWLTQSFYLVRRMQNRFARYTKAVFRLLIHDPEMIAQLRRERENRKIRTWMVERKL